MRALLMKTFGKQSHEAVLRRKREAGQRWKRRQTRQRLAFVFVMSICCTAHSLSNEIGVE